MKKNRLIFIILLFTIFFYRKDTYAEINKCNENINVSICTSNCDYEDLQSAIDYISTFKDCSTDNINISIGSGEYNIENLNLSSMSNIKIIGEGINKTIINVNSGTFIGNKSISISNIKINSKDEDSLSAISFVGNTEAVIDNILLNSNSDYGLWFWSNQDVTINASTINNSKVSAIYRAEYNKKNSFIIKNSNLSNNHCSFIESDGDAIFDEVSNTENSIATEYTSTIENSEINCLASLGGNDYIPNINAQTNNKWIQEPIYGRNVYAKDGGTLTISYEVEKKVNILETEQIKLNEIFKNLNIYNNISWTVQDDSIAKIEDDKLIPLKTGSTILIGKNDNIELRLNLKVEESLTTNPSTSYQIQSFVIIVALLVLITIIIKINGKHIYLSNKE